MKTNENELLAKMREQFLTDPDEQIGAIESQASNLPGDPTGVLRDMMRTAHNIKGSAQIAGFTEFGDTVHEVETLFQTLLKHNISADGLQDCMMLTRRLGTLLRKKFEALRDGVKEEHRDIAAWEVTVQGLTTIAVNSPTAGDEITESRVTSQEDAFDNWGLEITADAPPLPEEPQRFDKFTSNAPAATVTAETAQSVGSNTIDMSQGWGIFEDSAPTQKSLNPEPNQIPASVKPDLIASTTAAQKSPKDQNKDQNTATPAANTPTPTIKRPETVDGGDTYLLCHQGETTYALPVRFVQEIMPDRQLKPLPIARKQVAGVISFRGQVMPVLDILSESATTSANFDQLQDKTGQNGAGCIIVCEIGRRVFGFRIDQVSTVIEVKDSQLQAVHTKLNTGDKNLVSHLAHIEGKAISFLNLGGVITH